MKKCELYEVKDNKIIKSSEKTRNVSVAHTESSWLTMEIVTPVVNADTLNGKLKIRKLKIFFNSF